MRGKCGLGIARSILVVSAVAVIEDLLFEEENPEDVTMPIFVWRKALVCIGASSPKLPVDLFVWRNGKLESLSA